MELVRISPEYIEQLRKVDYRVQSNASEQGKDTKPFLGVLFTLKSNGAKYFVPLSSPKAKHQNMPNSSDFHKVIDKKGRLRAVLNFNNMVPATTELCTRIDLHTDKDRFVLMDEYLFCRDNEEMLKKKAQKFYTRYYKGDLSEGEKKRTCDFRKLEEELQKYLLEHHLTQKPNESKSEQTHVEEKSEEKKEPSSNSRPLTEEERIARAMEVSARKLNEEYGEYVAHQSEQAQREPQAGQARPAEQRQQDRGSAADKQKKPNPGKGRGK